MRATPVKDLNKYDSVDLVSMSQFVTFAFQKESIYYLEISKFYVDIFFAFFFVSSTHMIKNDVEIFCNQTCSVIIILSIRFLLLL